MHDFTACMHDDESPQTLARWSKQRMFHDTSVYIFVAVDWSIGYTTPGLPRVFEISLFVSFRMYVDATL